MNDSIVRGNNHIDNGKFKILKNYIWYFLSFALFTW